jgi:hypothetical protein
VRPIAELTRVDRYQRKGDLREDPRALARRIGQPAATFGEMVERLRQTPVASENRPSCSPKRW